MTVKQKPVARTGGQWNFSGVLYQLLVTLKSGLTAVVEEVALDRDSASVRIVVEPDKGGDAQTIDVGKRTVDQIKIRRGTDPWTTRTIIEAVLPDLFKATGDKSAQTRFRFLTDNLEGTTAFASFLATVRNFDAQGKGPANLDTLERPFRWGAERVSPESLFTRIGSVLDAPDAEVWTFLTAIDIVGWSQAAISGEIDAILTELVSEREEVGIKRKALLMHLLSLGTAGGSISAEALLMAVDLSAARLTLARRLPQILSDQVRQAVQSTGYIPAVDVRVPTGGFTAPLNVLSGDSGQGKTWRLCRAAVSVGEAGGCALLLPAKGKLGDIEKKIVELTWLQAFDRPLPLARVAERLGPKLADETGVWLTLFLDDLADPALALELAHAPWASLGVRVVITAQHRTTRVLTHHVEALSEIAVPNFTLAEVRDYLARSQRDPNLVPDDVLLSLARPVMAAIYCKIPGSAQWTAVSEYELVDRYWQWATTMAKTQPFHASDGYALLKLAGDLFGPRPIYPWTPSVAERLMLSADVRDRLITVGILQETTSGDLKVAHDRILNWAAALEIERRFLEGELTVDGVSELLVRMDSIATQRGDPIGRRLGYVIHDLFWKLAKSVKPEDVGTLALLSVRSGAASREHEHFFEAGLGSMGTDIIPALAWLAREPYDKGERLLPHHIAKALVAIASGAPSEVAEIAHRLVLENREHSRTVGLIVLKSVAAPKALDLLWTINCERNLAMIAAKGDGEQWSVCRRAKDQSYDALSRAVRADPEWLKAKSQSVATAEDAEQLIWLMLGPEVHVAKPIWLEAKGRLLAQIPSGSHSIPRIVRYFRDGEELGRLEIGLAKAQPMAAALWFDALVVLAPERALALLPSLTSRDLSGTSHWWLQGLVRRVGPVAHLRLAETIGVGSDDPLLGRRDLAMLYSGQEDLLDGPTFDLLIDSLEACLELELQGQAELPGVRRHLRSLIASANTPVLLHRLSARKGGRFERLICERAGARPGRGSMMVDREGGEYHRILAAIGGDGYDALVLAEMNRESLHGRTDGVTAATWTRSAQVRERLEALVEGADGDTYRQIQLMHALAAHRADAGLRAMVQGGSPVFLRAVEIRADGPPWSDQELAKVESLLKSHDVKERRLGINLCGFLDLDQAGALLSSIVEGPAPAEDEADLIWNVLRHLGYYRPSFLPLVKAKLTYDDGGHAMASYLAWSGDAVARQAVVDWLTAHALIELQSSLLPIAFQLVEFEDSAAGARAFLKRVWKRGLGWGAEGRILAILAEAGDNEAGAAMDAIAYQRPRRGEGAVVAAIRAVGRTSPTEAIAAAERFYRQTRASAAVHLLLELNAPAGMAILLGDYPTAPVPVRHQIGRLLRRAAPLDALVEQLDEMSLQGQSRLREAAAELAGWLPYETSVAFLDRLADDEAEAVEKAALTALRQRQADADCAALIGAIAGQVKARQWAWLNALIERGDPAHLSDANDPRSIHTLLDQLGDEFREEASTLLDKRTKALERLAAKLETKREV